MMSNVDTVLARYDEMNVRAERKLRELASSQEGRAAARRLRQRGGSGVRKRVVRAAGVLVATFIVLALFYGVFGAIGIDGFILLVAALAIALGTALFWPARKAQAPTIDTIRNAELAALPVRVERWLEARRAALPTTAARQVDELLLRLEVLATQLEKVEGSAPVVQDARKLIGEELPRLVESFTSIPEAYRQRGSEAEAQLHEGLETISAELKRLSEQLARGDLDRLAIEGRFLEIKYRQGDAPSGGEAGSPQSAPAGASKPADSGGSEQG